MKLHVIALAAVAALASGTASAARVTVTDANRVNMLGASALRNSIAGFVYADVCRSSTNITLYNLTRPGGPGNSGTGPVPTANFWAITCTLAVPFVGTSGTIPAGTDLSFFKSDQGGSGQGVYPIIQGQSKPQVLVDITQCTNPNVTLNSVSTPNPAVADVQYTGCVNDPTARLAHFGVSDIEPDKFFGENKPTDDTTYNEALLVNNDLQTAAVVQTVFGVAVNRALYEALQTAQGITSITGCTVGNTTDACQPSIGKAQAATFFAGFAPDWGILGVSAPSNQINICRRVNGSGTQAAANRQLLEYPCSASALSPAGVGFSNPAVAPLSPTASAATVTSYINANVLNASGKTFVFEGPGTGDVISCLNRAQTVGGYAIGHVSKENLIGADWRHVKLDGVSPNRDNAKAGKYDYLFESTIQYSATTFNTLNANQKAFITGTVAQVGLPDSLARLSAGGQEGVAALNATIPFGTGTANQQKFFSRVTRGNNSCTPLTLFQ